jgi:hypothetical protein
MILEYLSQMLSLPQQPINFLILEISLERIQVQELVYYPIWGFECGKYFSLDETWRRWLSDTLTSFGHPLDEIMVTLLLSTGDNFIAGSGYRGSVAVVKSFVKFITGQVVLSKAPQRICLCAPNTPDMPVIDEAFCQELANFWSAEPVAPFPQALPPHADLCQACASFPVYLPYDLGLLIVVDEGGRLATKALIVAESGAVKTTDAKRFTVRTPPLYAGLCEKTVYLILIALPPAETPRRLGQQDAFEGPLDTALVLSAVEVPAAGLQNGVSYLFTAPGVKPTLEQKHTLLTDSDLKKIRFNQEFQQLQSAQIAFLIDGTLHPNDFYRVQTFIETVCHAMSNYESGSDIGAIVYGDYLSPPNNAPAIARNWISDFDTIEVPFTHPDVFLQRVAQIELQTDDADYCNALELGLRDLRNLAWNAGLSYVILVGNSPPHPSATDSLSDCLPAATFANGQNWREMYRLLVRRLAGSLKFYSVWVEPGESRKPSKAEYNFAKQVWRELATDHKVISIEESAMILNRIEKEHSQHRRLEKPVLLPFCTFLDAASYRAGWC